jgi:hypothetical protein
MAFIRSALALALVAFAIVQYPLLQHLLPDFNRLCTTRLGAIILPRPVVILAQGIVFGERTPRIFNPNSAIQRFLGTLHCIPPLLPS